MKIAFSTLGCPGWSWEDILVTAKDLGFQGIEIRGIENELYVPKTLPFNETHIMSTIERLKKLNLEIPILTSSSYLFKKGNIGDYISEGKEYIDIASQIGAPYIRVLGDSKVEPGNNIDIEFVAHNLKILAEYASDKNVMVLIETNGDLADSRKMLRLLELADSSNIGVLWDIHHPFRFFGEPIEDTYKLLKEKIKFIHIKDSEVFNGNIKYRMVGNGDVPVKEALLLLKKNNYNGFVSLEWVKRWCMDLEDPGIVFSHFVNYVKNILE